MIDKSVIRLFLAGLAAVLMSPAAVAQWTVSTEAQSEDEDPVEAAVVENDSGHSLSIYRGEGDVVLGLFRIRDGFDTLASPYCPTYEVNRHEPAILGGLDPPCEIDGRVARFVLGSVEDERIESTLLLNIMNGSYMVLRYRLQALGYRETRFSLSGSKQALNEVLGGATVDAE